MQMEMYTSDTGPLENDSTWALAFPNYFNQVWAVHSTRRASGVGFYFICGSRLIALINLISNCLETQVYNCSYLTRAFYLKANLEPNDGST